MSNPSLKIGASMDTLKPLQGPKTMKPMPTTNEPVERQEPRQNQPTSLFDQTVDTEPTFNNDKKR